MITSKNLGWLQWAWYHGSGWFRIFGRGISSTNGPRYFSERHGYRVPFLRIGNRRFFWLKKGK